MEMFNNYMGKLFVKELFNKLFLYLQRRNLC